MMLEKSLSACAQLRTVQIPDPGCSSSDAMREVDVLKGPGAAGGVEERDLYQTKQFVLARNSKLGHLIGEATRSEHRRDESDVARLGYR